MSFRPCFLIPHYNHADAIAGVLDRLAAFGLAVFVVDDGSAPASREQLAAVCADRAGVTLIWRPENGGKGAAMIDGFRATAAAGFSHAFQIDADGQHDTSEVPAFLALAEASPGCLINGRPVYDQSVPKARLYGRKITDFWVMLETWTTALADAMCGFRIYPLAPLLSLLAQHRLPLRMDFDIAVLVNLHWQGVPMQFRPVKVCYPEGGVSHFDALRDNLRISRCHSGLFFGMLARAPGWLLRGRPGQRHWAGLREQGGQMGIRLLIGLYRVGGLRVLSLALYPVLFWFFLLARMPRRASQQFFARAYAAGSPALPKPPGWRDSFRQFLQFGQQAFDKFRAWMGEIPLDGVRVDAESYFRRRQQHGGLLITAHLGNAELSRALAVNQDRPVTALVFTQHAKRFNDQLQNLAPKSGFNLVHVGEVGPHTIIDLQQRIAAGEWLVIAGDRVPVNSAGRVTRHRFLGDEADFAQGPFILAQLLACPVFSLFCLRDDDGLYTVRAEPLFDRVQWTRSTRDAVLHDVTAKWVAKLEREVLNTPHQWFNFFDFWQAARPLSP